LETFIRIRPLVDDPLYEENRKEALCELDVGTIDAPIVEMIRSFAGLPYCFTLQSCWGHFLWGDRKGERNTDPLPRSETTSRVEYRIAYVALCIHNSDQGRLLLEDLGRISSHDPDFIQVGCAEWFWQRHVNSYVLQVGPLRHKTKDRIVIGFQEALHIQETRNEFFSLLKQIVQRRSIEERVSGIPPGRSARF
jgi:hypothetical protein